MNKLRVNPYNSDSALNIPALNLNWMSFNENISKQHGGNVYCATSHGRWIYQYHAQFNNTVISYFWHKIKYKDTEVIASDILSTDVMCTQIAMPFGLTSIRYWCRSETLCYLGCDSHDAIAVDMNDTWKKMIDWLGSVIIVIADKVYSTSKTLKHTYLT